MEFLTVIAALFAWELIKIGFTIISGIGIAQREKKKRKSFQERLEELKKQQEEGA